MKDNTTTPAPAATSTALAKWDDETAEAFAALIMAGHSLTKEQAALPPKGWLKQVREKRRNELGLNSTFLMQQLSVKGFTTITRMTAEKTHKDGCQSVTLELRTAPKNPAAEALAAANKLIEELRAQLAMKAA